MKIFADILTAIYFSFLSISPWIGFTTIPVFFCYGLGHVAPNEKMSRQKYRKLFFTYATVSYGFLACLYVGRFFDLPSSYGAIIMISLALINFGPWQFINYKFARYSKMRLNDIGRLPHGSLILFICGKFIWAWLIAGFVSLSLIPFDDRQKLMFLFLSGLIFGAVIWLALVIYMLIMPGKQDTRSEDTPLLPNDAGQSS